jgi:(p)ppGpp synthase/HD superfamily hydrolase
MLVYSAAMYRSERPDALYGPRVGEALKFAADAFSRRVRKGSGTPYLTHLLSVAVLVAEHGGDEDQIIAAVLHDYVEDIEGAHIDDVETSFGPKVAHIVLMLSDATERPKPPWEDRKRSYIARLRAEGPDVKLVAAADKMHNATSILRDYAKVGEGVFALFTVPKSKTLWYYRAVYDALSDGFDHPLVTELGSVVRALHDVTHEPWPGR